MAAAMVPLAPSCAAMPGGAPSASGARAVGNLGLDGHRVPLGDLVPDRLLHHALLLQAALPPEALGLHADGEARAAAAGAVDDLAGARSQGLAEAAGNGALVAAGAEAARLGGPEEPAPQLAASLHLAAGAWAAGKRAWDRLEAGGPASPPSLE
eukprot:CAMPEP_0171223538 /NCGR_PEP_ID=MMETSP0790-20130122/35830_1 /TAXON_ID=2925 /ORGANISM="Alexandrium catenella, Strain OF101" /LENGTH=153 /DNA_ID=CAMNT_0011689517 /DNA_START=11 /DNA_END=470 /DNA_ORIENTATION=-